ncbi:helix-turn-helix transcriptional regulator [Ruegeria arenilitoris]|uniref:helix-turn-helix transcriptional regulator n=1 Tax=Ruegeria arenilitoris TaxID=1173585 RepID=UPI00147A4FFF|nr:helix-turn-helix transcriptional regulator [Ruegeria arenilitoris]
MSEFLTTRELADLLRIGERKAYDLASSGEVPCVKAMGKLLFPRAEVLAWLNASRTGPDTVKPPLPDIVAGSHDPLLDWALRESGSGLATYYDGSFDGLNRLARRDAQAAVLHIHEPGGFNVNSVRDALGEAPVVLYEVASRQRGLLLAPEVQGISDFGDLKGRRIVLRQDSAASQHLFDAQLESCGLSRADLDALPTCARTEEELAIALHDRKAEAGFGIGALARLYGLGFIPTHSERLDLAIWRRSCFDPPMQKLLTFLGTDKFRRRADELGGYYLSGLGQIHHNGASD